MLIHILVMSIRGFKVISLWNLERRKWQICHHPLVTLTKTFLMRLFSVNFSSRIVFS